VLPSNAAVQLQVEYLNAVVEACLTDPFLHETQTCGAVATSEAKSTVDWCCWSHTWIALRGAERVAPECRPIAEGR
jgi:hypothetical protein